MKKTFLMIALSALCAVGAWAQKPVITFEETHYNFGDIHEEDGKVTHVFTFRNDGMSPLVLSNVRASCGCTTPSWTKTPVEPGQSGTINVTYNPSGRPGTFHKTVTITSNAEKETERITIEGKVLPKQAKPKDKYPVKMGEVALNERDVNFGNVNKGDVVTRELVFTNTTDKPVNIALRLDAKDAAFIETQVTPVPLEPGNEGTIKLALESSKAKVWGDWDGTIYVVVDDQLRKTETYAINLKANIKEDFSKLTVEEKQKAPILEIETMTIDLGVIKPGQKAAKDIVLRNGGINPLEIRRVKTSARFTQATASKTTIKGGKQAKLHVETMAVDENGQPQGVIKRCVRPITLITNDPNHSEIKIDVVWEVAE